MPMPAKTCASMYCITSSAINSLFNKINLAPSGKFPGLVAPSVPTSTAVELSCA